MPIRGYRFFRANIHTHKHTHTHRDKVIAISAPSYYVVGADNNNYQIYTAYIRRKDKNK